MKTTVMWFRRDLRLADNPALQAAARDSKVLPVFVIDPRQAGAGHRLRRLHESLAMLRVQTGGALVVRRGDPREIIASLAQAVGASEVHVTSDSTPYGRSATTDVEERLAQRTIDLVQTDSPYAVAPGRILNGLQAPYQVFTPFLRAWREHCWQAPFAQGEVEWILGIASDDVPVQGETSAGELAALNRWQDFCEQDLDGYATQRDRPDLDGTSRLSAALAFGEIHPRTMLADLSEIAGQSRESGTPSLEDVDRFVAELGWREFYADVLWHHPDSVSNDLRDGFRGMRYDEELPEIDAGKAGKTGFPLVDAGMRQLQETGWMHNRVRMVVASFLVKDLHVWWPIGATYFLEQLEDGDVASNIHSWQWVAGTGTDAAPYFRVFNPVTQGKKFDPNGDYVRTWVPELRHLSGAAAHEPWRHLDGYAHGYPTQIVDHAQERVEALARLAELREA